jgi:CheY-like chemotaxis protein
MYKKIKILLYEKDNAPGAVESIINNKCVNCELKRTCNTQEFLSALKTDVFDVILSDNEMPDLDIRSAFRFSKEITPHSEFIYVSSTVGTNDSTKKDDEERIKGIPHADIDSLPPTLDKVMREVISRQDMPNSWG